MDGVWRTGNVITNLSLESWVVVASTIVVFVVSGIEVGRVTVRVGVLVGGRVGLAGVQAANQTRKNKQTIDRNFISGKQTRLNHKILPAKNQQLVRLPGAPQLNPGLL